MSVPSSGRPPREWVHLVLALLIVGSIVAPAWQLAGTPESRADFLAKWTPDRLTRLLLGPEQVACYLCAVWAGLILLGRGREVRRQRAAFGWDMLPTDEGARILRRTPGRWPARWMP